MKQSVLDGTFVGEPEKEAPQRHQIVGADGKVTRDKPWIIRTYAGHSSAKASNELYRSNLSGGRPGCPLRSTWPRSAATTPTIRSPAPK